MHYSTIRIKIPSLVGNHSLYTRMKQGSSKAARVMASLENQKLHASSNRIQIPSFKTLISTMNQACQLGPLQL